MVLPLNIRVIGMAVALLSFFISKSAAASGLPAGYTRVENIIFKSLQYLQVPHGDLPNVGCQMKVNISKRGGSSGPHVINADSANNFWIVCRLPNGSSGNGIMAKYFGKESNISAADSYLNGTGIDVETIIDINSSGDGTSTVNGNTVTFVTSTSTLSEGLFHIGSYYVQKTNSSFAFYGTLSYIRIFSNGVLVIDLVPCKNPNGVAGLYDVMSEQSDAFYTGLNSGTAIAAGKEVADPLEVLEVTSTPIMLAATDPASGTTTNVAAGSTLRLTAPEVWTNVVGDVRAELLGWVLYETDDGVSYRQVSSGEGGVYDYTNLPAKMRRLEWRWRYFSLLTASAVSPAAVAPAQQWVELAEVGAVNVTSASLHSNFAWETEGGMENGVTTGRTVRVVGKAPRSQSFLCLPFREGEKTVYDDSFLTSDWTAIATGYSSVADMVVMCAIMNGSGIAVKGKSVLPMAVHVEDGIKLAQFQTNTDDSRYIKCLDVAFKVENGVVFARIEHSFYVNNTIPCAGYERIDYRTSTAVSIATTPTSPGYGIASVTIAPRLKSGLLLLVR